MEFPDRLDIAWRRNNINNTMEIHILQNDKELGPFSLKDVNEMLLDGRLNVEDMAWHEDLEDWLELRQLKGVVLPAPSAHVSQRASHVSPDALDNNKSKDGSVWQVNIGNWCLSKFNLFLELLDKGKVVRVVLGRFIQAIGAIIGLGLLYLWVRLFGALEFLPFFAGLTLVLWQVFFPLAVFACVMVIRKRGEEIIELPDSEFVVTPIIAIIITTIGEVALIFLGVMSLPAMLLVWIAGSVASDIIPISIGDGLSGGIMAFLSFWVAGFLIYVISRWFRESAMTMFSIARNVDLIQARILSEDSTNDTT